MQSYMGITRAPVEQETVDAFIRERFDAAWSILERIIGQDIEDEVEREMERRANKAERHQRNLMMAGRALEAIRSANGHILEQDFTDITRSGIYKTPYGLMMSGVKEVLEKFWTEE